MNSHLLARGSQEAGFTQPRDHSFAQPCTFDRALASHLAGLYVDAKCAFLGITFEASVAFDAAKIVNTNTLGRIFQNPKSKQTHADIQRCNATEASM